VAAAIVLVVAALGAPLGLLWAALAPTVPVRMTEDGALLTKAQPEEFIAADGWFALLGLGFGALAAIGVWLVVRRGRGPLALLAVTFGAVVAGLLAWWLGRQMGVAEYERLLDGAPVGAVFSKPADLRAADAELLFGFLPVVRGDALVPGLGAAVTYTLLAGWSRFASLRPHEEPDPHGDPIAWDAAGGSSEPGAAGGSSELGAAGGSSAAGGPVSSGWTGTPAHPAEPAPPAPGGEAPPRD
jgi:hypothetical protein